ncbi:MAG: diguanylate cyclase, partial [Oscillibacter sp.]|nr:diguanylate cyclase [Oscillibacter sp.]
MRRWNMNTQFAAILLIVAATFVGNALFVSALNADTLRTTVENETELFASLLADTITSRVPEGDLQTLRNSLPAGLLASDSGNGVQCWIASRTGQVLMRLGVPEAEPDNTLYEALGTNLLLHTLENDGETLWLGRRNPFVLREDCCVLRPLYDGKLFLAAVNRFEPLQALQRRHITLLMGIDILLTALMIVLISNLVFKYRREILRYATTDELTGLANRKSFNAAFAEFIASGRREASLFLLDIDFFKQINDNYGHAAGD